jgi:acyl-CoA reductase-like NAD-dependent aldehyde dehydrogenase
MNTADIDWVSRYRALEPHVMNFVEGRRKPAPADTLRKKYSPRDGRLLYQGVTAEPHDINEAVASARRAFADGRWSKMSVQRRKDVLMKFASLLDAHRTELALLESVDVGKPIREAFNYDVPSASANIRFSAEAADKYYSKVYGTDQSSLSFELRHPVGVVAGLVGWNFPLCLAIQKIGPVLATGNSLVLKPSELTGLSASRIAELAVEAGVPFGVFNVVHGDGRIGSLLAHHPDVDLLTFTGSTRTGNELLKASGNSNMKRLILECGGKSPNVVFDDCPNPEAVAEAVVASAFWNQGQVCVASSRLLVQEGIKQEILDCVVRKVAALAPSDPLDSRTRFGALVSQEHKQKVLSYIRSGEQEGAELVHQSDASPPFEAGFYVPPTVFSEVRAEHRIAQEEIFGPVLSVMAFRDEQAAIQIANSTRYGLSAVLWTRDMGRAHRMSHSINAGWVVVNATDAPTGGPGDGILSIGGHKQSGIGTEGGIEGLEAYTSKTAVQFFF